MTMVHKLTLAGIAAVCVLVIAVNLNTSSSATSQTPPAAVIDSNAKSASVKTQPVAAATRVEPGSDSLVLGPRLTEARGLQDLVSEIREVTKQDDVTPQSQPTVPAEPAPLQPAQTQVTTPLPAPEQSPAAPAALAATIEPQTLTLGPAPTALADSRPAITEEDWREFADIPEEIELPPVSSEGIEEPALAESEFKSELPPLPALAKTGVATYDSGSTFKPYSLPAEPPGTTAPPAPSLPPVIAKANEPARIIAPPPAKANEPALAEKVEPKKRDTPREDTPKTSDVKTATDPAKSYTIQPGDTYSSIAIVVYGAERHWMEIAEANPDVDPKRLKVGQAIKLPVLGAEAADRTAAKAPAESSQTNDTAKATPGASAASAAKPADSSEKTHEVKAGENLSTISRQHFNTPDHWRHIYLTNRQAIGGDPGKLQAGMKLKITTPTESN